MLYLASELNYLAAGSVSGARSSFSHCFSCPDKAIAHSSNTTSYSSRLLGRVAVRLLVTRTAFLQKSLGKYCAK